MIILNTKENKLFYNTNIHTQPTNDNNKDRDKINRSATNLFLVENKDKNWREKGNVLKRITKVCLADWFYFF